MMGRLKRFVMGSGIFYLIGIIFLIISILVFRLLPTYSKYNNAVSIWINWTLVCITAIYVILLYRLEHKHDELVRVG